MKRLLKLAGVDALQSFLPVLMWMILPVFTGDPMWAEGYIVTYPYQFIGLILYNVIFKSQVKLDMDELGRPGDRTKTGIIVYALSWAVLITVSISGWESVRTLFGLGPEYEDIFHMSLINLGLSYIVMSVVCKKQYEGKNGFSLTVSWWAAEIFGCFILTRTGLPVILTLIFMAAFCVVITVYETEQFRIQFDVRGISICLDLETFVPIRQCWPHII